MNQINKWTNAINNILFVINLKIDDFISLK